MLSAFFLTKILNILKKGDSFQEFLFSAALFSVSSDPEFPAGDCAGAPQPAAQTPGSGAGEDPSRFQRSSAAPRCRGTAPGPSLRKGGLAE